MKQLSQYFGFQFIINWDTSYDLRLPNYSFVHPHGPPLELGHFTKMKKEHSNKTLIDHPEELLEVVHCNIVDINSFPHFHYTDFDCKILDGHTASCL